MFPNPQDAVPLPPQPNLEQYKKLAKDLVKICKTRNPRGLQDWAARWIENLARLNDWEKGDGRPVDKQRWIDGVSEFATKKLLSGERRCALTDAHFVVARSHGFTSWPTFVKHIEQLMRKSSPVAQFEAAADAIVSGDVQTLKRLLRENPNLVRERSAREHRATLLHYTSANGVEGYRQKTPKNIVEIANLLARSGADVDAEADVYGGGCTTLGLAATSIHPERAGVQEPLLQVLLDHGASIEKPNLAGNAQSAVIACLANGRPRAGEFLAAHGAKLDLESAAGLGRIDVVETFFGGGGTLTPPATQRQLQNGFLWACMYGRKNVVLFLLDHGADLVDPVDSGATALHWAAGGGHPSIVSMLLDRGAPLEEINRWGGTVLEHAGWGFEHDVAGSDFAAVFETLLAAGAKIRGRWLAWIERVKMRSAEEKTHVAEIFRRYGASA
jgi:Ankyrin repeats (3 copies)